MAERTVIIWAEFHPFKGKWSSAAVQMNTPGTHEKYNMLHNSVCDSLYFATEEEAKKFAEEVVQVKLREIYGQG